MMFFAHTIYMVYTIIYPYLFLKSRFLDFIYLFEEYLTYLSWTFYSGECLVHVMTKRKKDPTYVSGSNKDEENDVIKILGTGTWSNAIRRVILPVLRDVGLFIIMSRWKFPLLLQMSFILARESYIFIFCDSTDQMVHSTYTAIFSFILMYMVYRFVYK
jgi:hypothetical protein